jgi:large subunit ribosomal protein L30
MLQPSVARQLKKYWVNNMDNKVKVTLVKSLIGRKPKHLLTVKALGLNKMNSSVVLSDNSANRGKLNQVNYLLKIEEVK